MQVNYYTILGITRMKYLQKDIITDEFIKEKYETLKKSLESQLKSLKEKSEKEQNIKNIMKSLKLLEEAYNMLNTSEKRQKYDESLKKGYWNIYKIGQIIEQEGGNPNKKLNTKIKNLSNRAADVRNNKNYLEYTPEYEDDKLEILGLEEINFLNGNQFKDNINSYTIFFKDENGNKIPSGYDFYTKITKIYMSSKEYRIALYQAIKEGMKTKQKYIGVIEKSSDGNYHILADDGQKYASMEREIQKENKRNKKYIER